MTTYYSFGRISDKQVLDLMDELLAKFKISDATVELGEGSFNVSKTEEGGLSHGERDAFKGILTSHSYLITRMWWRLNGVSIEYLRARRRGLNQGGQEIWLVDNAFLDAMAVKITSGNVASVLKILSKHIDMAPPIVGGEEAGSALDQSQAILNRVSNAVATLVEHTADRQKDLDKTKLELSREAQKALKEAQADFDEKLAKTREDYASKEKALNDRAKTLDDRANTHVRRQFAKQMASLSDTRLSTNLLTQSRLSFWIPIVLATIPIIALGVMIYVEVIQISELSASISTIVQNPMIEADTKSTILGSINSQILYSQIRIGIQSLGLAALVWFSLRLASSRYALVSAWERELHKFRLDTERAGFLVEGDLEARKVNERGLPDVLLQSFSRNLFAGPDRSSVDTDREGLGEALTAILGQAAKLRIGPDGISAEVDARGLRRAKKVMDD